MEDSKGHRERLLSRYSEAGIVSLQEYEILELLLALCIPRKDTKPLAKELLKRFGSIHGVLSADRSVLEEFTGIGKRSATVLNFLFDYQALSLKEKVRQKTVISSQFDVQEYLRYNFCTKKNEYFIAIFLDNRNRVIDSEILFEGTVDHCPVYPRKLFDRAFRVGAAGVIIAHNHPGGSTTPSDADWAITLRLFEAGKLLDIALTDHILIADSEIVSFRSLSRWPH